MNQAAFNRETESRLLVGDLLAGRGEDADAAVTSGDAGLAEDVVVVGPHAVDHHLA